MPRPAISAAIVAHFDAQDRVDANFKEVLRCLSQRFERIIFVTTSQISAADVEDIANLELVCRPNIGYDFFSYRVGITRLAEDGGADVVALVNSSIMMIHRSKFLQMIDKAFAALSPGRLVGITQSNQIASHIQSYFILMSGSVFRSPWFTSFVSQIWPQDSKFDLIVRYEIGLSQAAIAAGLQLAPIFMPSNNSLAAAEGQWKKWLIEKEGLAAYARRSAAELSAFNHTQFLAAEIATTYGIVKNEVAIKNPHQIDLDFIEHYVEPSLRTSVRSVIETAQLNKKTMTSALGDTGAKISALPSALSVSKIFMNRPKPSVAVVFHIYYEDIIDEFVAVAKAMIEPVDIFVTTPHESLVTKCFEAFSFTRSVTVFLSENRGRDIGPFISLLKSGKLDDYTAVLKCHSKKSKYSTLGEQWRKQILHGVAGSSWIVRQSLDLIKAGAGIVGPHFQYLRDEQYWGANRVRVNQLLTAMGVQLPSAGARLGFFGGSMFWFSPKALEPIKKIEEEAIRFEPEQGLQDGTMAHAFERLFCKISRAGGFRTTSIVVQGNEIDDIESVDNKVLVLN